MRHLLFLALFTFSAIANTPDMDLALPTVGSTTGPTWATMLNTALTTIDSHDHSPGKGTYVTPSGLNINANLSFGGNRATTIQACTFDNQGSSLTYAGSIHEVNKELVFTDGNSNQVLITNGGFLNGSGFAGKGISYTKVAADNSGSGTPLVSDGSGGVHFSNISFSTSIATKTSNYSISSSDGTILCDTTSNIVNLTLPAPASNSGKIIIIKKINSALTNACNIKPNAAETIDGLSIIQMKIQYMSVGLQTDGTNWYIIF